MKRKWSVLLLGFFWLALCQPIRAQEVLSYEACLQRALQQNIALRQGQLDLELANVQLKTKRASLLPVANVTLRNNNSLGRAVDPATNQFIDRKLSSLVGAGNTSVYLFDGLSAISAIKAAKQDVQQNVSRLQALRNDLTIDVAVDYIRINFLLELLKSQQQQVEASALLVRLTRLKLSAGTVAESALFKLLSQQATEQLEVVKNNNELALAYLDLRQLMNVPLTDSFRIVPLAYASPTLYTVPSRTEVAAAVENQPALTAQKHAASELYYQIGVARANRLPTLQLIGTLGSNYSNGSQQYDFNNQINNNLSYGGGLLLSVPIFNGLRYSLLIKESRLRHQQGLLDVMEERNRLNKVVQQAVNDAAAASQGWLAAAKAEEYARKSYEADQLRYEYGTVSAFELNQSKVTYLSAQTDLFKAKYEFILRSKLVAFYQGEPLIL